MRSGSCAGHRASISSSRLAPLGCSARYATSSRVAARLSARLAPLTLNGPRTEIERAGSSCVAAGARVADASGDVAVGGGASAETGASAAVGTGQEFYELKHRAIQWMVDPVEDGGLGLDPATVAEMVGHDDGGYLIATVYTKLGRRPRARPCAARDGRLRAATSSGRCAPPSARRRLRIKPSRHTQRAPSPHAHAGRQPR